jgi:DNA-binding beta-propeller fold protein YncE
MVKKSFFLILSSFLIILLVCPAIAMAEITYSYNSSWPADKRPYFYNYPTGLAVDSDGAIYVADRNNDHIQVISYGTGDPLVRNWSNSGAFSLPSGLAVRPSGTYEDSFDVFIADKANHQVQKWTSAAGYGFFIKSWGTRGSGIGQFSFPSAVALDSGGNVYVVDTGNNRIQKFNSNGDYLSEWGGSGTGNGQFNHPSAIFIDGSGNVFVADTGNNRVQKFNSSGSHLLNIGSTGTGNGQFQSPSGVAVDGSGYIYVSDMYNHRVQQFNSSGVFQTKWGTNGTNDGQLHYPHGLAFYTDGNILVADSGNNRIQKFTPQGVLQETYSNIGTTDGYFFEPAGAAVSPGGDLYVADSVNCRIQRFDSDGQFVAKWGTFGGETGNFKGPSGVAIDSLGNIYVADTVNNRVQKFNVSGTYITQWGTPGTGNGQFDFPNGIAIDASDNVYVLDSGNNRVQKFSSSGSFLAKWGSGGSGDSQFDSPMGIAADRSGNIFVSDTGNNRVQKFSSTGTFINKWGTIGNQLGALNMPSALAVNNSGNVFVVDTGNHRVQEFTTDGAFVRSFGAEGTDPSQSFIYTYFKYPRGIAFNAAGDIMYVIDSRNNRIQRFDLGGIQLNSPKSGQHLPRGTKPQIAWTYLGNTSFLLITLMKGEDFISYIPPSYPMPTMITIQSGNGTYADWTIPVDLTPGDDYKILLQAGTSFSTSDNFSITGTQNTLTIAGASGTAGGKVSGGIGLICSILSNGTSSGTCSEYNDPNAAIVLTATPDPRATVTWTNCTSASGNACNVTLSSSKTVTARFNLKSYTITTLPGANGSITCSPASVYNGENSVCAITPNSGYYVSDVQVGPTGGTLTSVGAVTSYAITGVAANMTISAQFQQARAKRTGTSTHYFYTLTDAYATASENDNIQALAATFEGDLNLNHAVRVLLSGGYAAGFSSQTGSSEIHGALTISLGAAIVDRITVK